MVDSIADAPSPSTYSAPQNDDVENVEPPAPHEDDSNAAANAPVGSRSASPPDVDTFEREPEKRPRANKDDDALVLTRTESKTDPASRTQTAESNRTMAARADRRRYALQENDLGRKNAPVAMNGINAIPPNPAQPKKDDNAPPPNPQPGAQPAALPPQGATPDKDPQDLNPITKAAPAVRIVRGAIGAANQTSGLPKVKLDDLKLGGRIGSGSEKHTYAFGDDQVASIVKKELRGGGGGGIDSDVKYAQDLKGVTFEGKNVAPKISHVITDADGNSIGYIAERLKGEELSSLTNRGGLTTKQMDEVERQLRGQMDALHGAGKIHGDPNIGNVMVHVGEDGNVTARFLDFREPDQLFGRGGDRELFENTIADARTRLRPDNVAAFQAKEEAQRIAAAQKQFTKEEKEVAENLRQQTKDLRKSLPQGHADKDFLVDVQTKLGMDGKESHLWTHEDFAKAAKDLKDSNAAERLRNMDLSQAGPEAQRMRDQLLRDVDGLNERWTKGLPHDPSAALHADVKSVLDPGLMKGLKEEDFARMKKLADHEGSRGAFADVMKGVKDPEAARAIMSALEKSDPEARRVLANVMKDIEPGKVAAFLGQKIGDRDVGEVLGKVLKALPEDTHGALGKVLRAFEPETAAKILKYAEHADGKVLGESLQYLEKALGKADPVLLKDAGKFFGLADELVAKSGATLGREVAGTVFHGFMKILPIVGALPAMYSVYDLGKHAFDSSLPPEIRFVAGAGAMLNGVDAGLMVAEAFGVGAPAIPVTIALGVGELALDLSVQHMIEQHKAGTFKSSPELDAIIAATGTAMAPAGMAAMLGLFGATRTEEMYLNLGKVGGKLAIDGAVKVGTLAAEGLGGNLKMSAKGIDTMADMLRNPEQYAKQLEKLGVKAADISQKALDGLVSGAKSGGEYAVRKLGEAADWLGAKGEEGVESLKWLAATPEGRAFALQQMNNMVVAGGKLAEKAWHGMLSAGKDGIELAKTTIDNLKNATGEAATKALETLKYIATKSPDELFQEVGSRAVAGITDLYQRGGALANRAAESLIGFINDQGKIGQKARDSVRELIQHAKDAPWDQMISAWKNNITEGGQAFLDSLGNLGDAGAEALGKLAQGGGRLAIEGAKRLGGMIDRGIDKAGDKLKQLAASLDPTELRSMLTDGSAKAARALYDGLGGDKIVDLFKQVKDAPATLRKLYDQMDWRHAKTLFDTMPGEMFGQVWGALDAPRIKEMISAMDGGFIQRLFDKTPDWGTVRSMFEASGSALNRKLAAAIGPERLAGLVSATNTSVDWIRTNLANAIDPSHMLTMIQRASKEGVAKIRAALDPDRLLMSAVDLTLDVTSPNDHGYYLLPNGKVPPWDRNVKKTIWNPFTWDR